MKWIPCIGVMAALVGSCASIGNPSGGPRDEEPPRFVRSNPAPGSVNVSRQRIDIEFDEIVNVKDAFSKVVVSPVTGSVPRVSSLGKRVTVQFTDTLLPNTTYTIDFGNSIEDNNENNKLQGFTYSFSTGPELDTLQISGMVLSAQGLEPQQGMLVGVYSNLSDTAFSTLPFERVAKTDDRGRFSIKGLSPGEYRIYALADADNDYKHANPEEAAAFYDFTLVPYAERISVTDTLFNLKTGERDTVLKRERTRFLPNDILLRSFDSDYKSQYLLKYERTDSTRLTFIFNAPSDSLPVISPVGIDVPEDWYVLEKSHRNDTLTYWITDPSVIAADSLRIAARYLRTDSARQLSAFADTLRFFMAKPKTVAKEKKKDKKGKEIVDTVPPKPIPLELRFLSQSNQEVNLPVIFEFETPLTRLDSASFRLETMIDSVWTPVAGFKGIESYDSINPRRFKIEYPWDYSTEYRITADSLATEGIYGRLSDPLEHKFKTKAEEDYCVLKFSITDFPDSVASFVELLSTSDQPVRREKVVNNSVTFRYLPPGKYYARIYEDRNGNGIFDTGNVDEFIQPDVAYYYPKLLNIKKNWEKQETWAVFETAIDLMKPDAIKKNQPERDKRMRNNRNQNQETDEEEEYFDPTRNPFDPNDRGSRYQQRY